MDELQLTHVVGAHKIGLAVALTKERKRSQVHIASGFILDGGEASQMIVTAGHFNKDVKTWLCEGLVRGFCVYFHSNQHEDNVREYLLDIDLLDQQLLYARNGHDVGLVIPEPELLEELHNHGVPRISWPHQMYVPSHETLMRGGYNLIVCGFSANGSKIAEVGRIWLPSSTGSRGTESAIELLRIGMLQSRFEPITGWESLDEGRLKLNLQTSEIPSAIGMSGGPVLLFRSDEVDQLRVVCQQIAEQPDGHGGISYLIANNNQTVVDGIKDCLAQRVADKSSDI